MDGKPYHNRRLLCELYHNYNKGLNEIADELGVSLSTISRAFNKHDIERRTAKAGELEDKSWMEQRYHGDGMSSTEIADELDCTHRTVLNWLERHGIERRERNERPQQLTDRDKMRELYVERDLSGHDIADRLDCNQKAVYRWLNKYDFDKTPKPQRRGKDNPQYKSGNRNYGDGWYAIRRDVRERDGACQSCGISRQRCKDEYGEDLHVHHVIPARKFDDSQQEQQNSKENLVALCRDCHERWEGIPVKPVLV